MRNRKSMAGLFTSGLLLFGFVSVQATGIALGQTAPSRAGTPANSTVTESNLLVGSQPIIRSLLPDDSLQEYCRDVRINAIVVPAFCSLLVQARTHYQQGNLQSAVDLYDRALHQHPEYSRGYYNRGIVHLSMGQTTQAKSDFVQAARLFQRQGDLVNFRKAVALANSLAS